MSSCLHLRKTIDKLESEKASLIDTLENIKEQIETLKAHEHDFNNVLHVEKSCLLIIELALNREEYETDTTG